MKYLLILTLVPLFALSACSGGDTQDQSTQALNNQQAQTGDRTQSGTEASGAKTAIDEAKTAIAQTEQAQLTEGQEITVSGTLGCGHCTYHVGDSCSAALQTKDGAIYILDVAQDSPWFQNRYSGLHLEVTGKVHHDGTLVLLKSTSITEL